MIIRMNLYSGIARFKCDNKSKKNRIVKIYHKIDSAMIDSELMCNDYLSSKFGDYGSEVYHQYYKDHMLYILMFTVNDVRRIRFI